MKRDMDLVRNILLYVEEHSKPSSPDMMSLVSGVEDGPQKLSYHMTMLVEEAGYLRGNRRVSVSASGSEYLYMEVTWDGHEFLETLRDPSIWEKTKKAAGAAGSTSVKVLLEVGTMIVKEVAIDQAKKLGILP